MKYLLLILAALSMPTLADSAKLTQDVQAVKNAVLELNKDLYQLERELLSPSSTQLAYYFALRGVDDFIPLSIEIKTENLPPVHHVYTERQITALKMGAVQPLLSTNIGPGEHSMEVTVRGENSRGQEQVIVLNKVIEKVAEPLLLEIALNQEQRTVYLELNVWR